MVKNSFIVRNGLFLLLGVCANVYAAPRLLLSQAAFTVTVAQGANGPTQVVEAANNGDGSLTLQTSSSVSWLVPSLGAQVACTLGNGTCTPVQIALQTASLAAGVFTGTVTITDPNAIDAPQFVTVTVQVGGVVPSKLEFFVQPSGSASSTFTTGSTVNTQVSNSPWLSIAVNGQGTFLFNVPYKVTASGNGMATGDYNGTITLSGSSFAPDNKSISVVMHVTTSPILQTNSSVQFRIAQGANKQTTLIATANAGQGTLTVSGVTAAAASGNWLSASISSAGPYVNITADPTGLTPNTYQGTVTIASNAANASVVVPVTLVVEAATPPVVFAGGVLNNGTFAGGEQLAQGDIVALFGDQLTFGDPTQASTLPLGTTLGGVQVLVNGTAAPLYYVSPGQVNFQIPINASTGNGTVSVVRNGTTGNRAFVSIASAVPRFLLLSGGPYAIMTTPSGSLTGIPGSPVKNGDTVVIYTIGMGQTSPQVPSGTASPGNPPATTAKTQVCFGTVTLFGNPQCTDAAFAGLTPGLVGLYQINVTIPNTVASGNQPVYFTVGGVLSNIVQLAVQ